MYMFIENKLLLLLLLLLSNSALKTCPASQKWLFKTGHFVKRWHESRIVGGGGGEGHSMLKINKIRV
jgi:hypothetical protein